MYVVRLKSIDGSFNFKVFASRLLALSSFAAGQSQVIDERLDESALFDVAAAYDAKIAIQSVREGRASLFADLSSANDRSPSCGMACGFGSLGVGDGPKLSIRERRKLGYILLIAEAGI
jgi:hypothetical protein